MKTEHKLAKSWRLVMGAAAVVLILLFTMPAVLGQPMTGTPLAFACATLLLVGAAGFAFLEITTSRIITSPEGIAWVSFGVYRQAPWSEVDAVTVSMFQVIALTFRRPVYASPLARLILRPLGYDRLIQLSPYIDDIATSPLLSEIEHYFPNDVTTFLRRDAKPRPWFQSAGIIGAYYLLLMVALIPFFALLRQGGEMLESVGYVNATLISQIASMSPMIGLLADGISLIGYPAAVSGLSMKEARIFALTCYGSPLLTSILGITTAVLVWLVLRGLSITLEEGSYGLFTLIGFVPVYASRRLNPLAFMWLAGKRLG